MFKKRSNNIRTKTARAPSVKKDDEDEYFEKIDGRVIDCLPNTHFRVETSKGVMIAYLGGKMRVHKIRILVGDKVELLLDEYGGKARLVKRL
jgi:translation initiation factor IF-1